MSNVCVILHGFGGGLEEIEYLKQHLILNNQRVETILLAGHGGTKKEMEQFTYLDWIESADRFMRVIKTQYDSITLIGFSMGGLICTHLQTRYKIDRLVLINTPVYFWNIKVIVNDESVKPKSAAFIKSKIKADATLKYYNGGCHQVFSKASDCRAYVCNDVLRFVIKPL